ncbi:MAG: type II toxin-antitoxin system VapC family toxin [Desulfovibrionales bacterium]|nr:MAG: type II toxin-antitoxin system VapC family toxin [Desulfovibrionales bacterium]
MDDHHELSRLSASILEEQEVYLPMEAACEIVYVLQKVYSVDRMEIADCLSDIVAENLVHLERPAVFLKTLSFFAATKLDFVDALLAAYHSVEGWSVLSFDKKLLSFLRTASKAG